MLNIDKDEFTRLVKEENYSVKDLQKFYGIGRSTVYSYKHKWGLVNTLYSKDKEGTKTCNICNINKPLSEFQSNGTTTSGTKKYKPSCSPCTNTARKADKYNKIDRILEESNRTLSCEMCGYSRNRAALTFHHLDPSEKEFSISQLKSSVSYEVLKDELDKCVLLCHNCHMEEHYPHLTIV